MKNSNALTKSDKLVGVQFARGIAASMVVFYHAGRLLALPQYIGHIAAHSFFNFGNAGIDFFFTLSGFIIFYVHERDLSRPARLGRYVWNRVTRIYPMYWLVTVYLILLAILTGKFQAFGFDHVFRSLLLLPEDQEPILGVGWTLVHEMFFYLVFALAILSKRVGLLVCAVLGLATLLNAFQPFGSYLLRFLSSAYHIQFLLGIGAAIALKKWPGGPAWIILSAGILLFVVGAIAVDVGAIDYSQALCRLMFGLGSAATIYGLAAIESYHGIRFSRWAEFLGAASYSIYLVQTICIGLAARIVFRSPAISEFSDLLFLAIAVGAIAAGCLSHLAIEAPLQRMLRSVSTNFFGKSGR